QGQVAQDNVEVLDALAHEVLDDVLDEGAVQEGQQRGRVVLVERRQFVRHPGRHQKDAHGTVSAACWGWRGSPSAAGRESVLAGGCRPWLFSAAPPGLNPFRL